jgi:hypothetical protein
MFQSSSLARANRKIVLATAALLLAFYLIDKMGGPFIRVVVLAALIGPALGLINRYNNFVCMNFFPSGQKKVKALTTLYQGVILALSSLVFNHITNPGCHRL